MVKFRSITDHDLQRWDLSIGEVADAQLVSDKRVGLTSGIADCVRPTWLYKKRLAKPSANAYAEAQANAKGIGIFMVLPFLGKEDDTCRVGQTTTRETPMSHSEGTNAQRIRLAVLRCNYGESFVIRTLSPQYGGLFVHVIKRKGEYCSHPHQPCRYHREPLQWKGYAAVQVWRPDVSLWVPATFELTESFELDVRPLWRRGQLWEVSRGPAEGEKGIPVVGRLVGEVALESLPTEFDYTPPVLAIYHVFSVDLGQPNPMPDRQHLEATPGNPPPVVPFQPRKDEYEEYDPKKIQDSMRKYLERKQKMKR